MPKRRLRTHSKEKSRAIIYSLVNICGGRGRDRAKPAMKTGSSQGARKTHESCKREVGKPPTEGSPAATEERLAAKVNQAVSVCFPFAHCRFGCHSLMYSTNKVVILKSISMSPCLPSSQRNIITTGKQIEI